MCGRECLERAQTERFCDGKEEVGPGKAARATTSIFRKVHRPIDAERARLRLGFDTVGSPTITSTDGTVS